MARKTRKKIDSFEHNIFGVTIPIYLEESMQFSAEYAGEQFADRDGGVLKQKLRKAVEDANQIEWVHLMSIEHSMGDRERSELLELKIDRFWACDRGRLAHRINEAGYEYEVAEHAKMDRSRPDISLGLRILGRSHVWHSFEGKPKDGLTGHKTSSKLDQGGHDEIILNDDESSIVMPFNQKLWDGLEVILKSVAAANKRIRELVGTPAGLQLVSSKGFALLGMGVRKDG